MGEKELSALLRKVHNELEDTERVSAEERQLLAELMTDIRAQLGDDGGTEHSLPDRLGDAVEQFNQSHPTLAFALRRVMDALAKMGI